MNQCRCVVFLFYDDSVSFLTLSLRNNMWRFSKKVFSVHSLSVDFNVLFSSMEDRCAVLRSCSVFGVFVDVTFLFHFGSTMCCFFAGVRVSTALLCDSG